ncbi:MAG: MurR/RpiR family transcriptional regulator [Roseinatronobacter sp.]
MGASFNLAERLLATYDDMPRGERKLADLLLEDVNAIRFFTASDLAGKARVSKATAARLFRRLGYIGYKQAQRDAREAPGLIAQGAAGAGPKAETLSPGAYLDAEVKHLVRTFEVLPADVVTQAVTALHEGEKLWVVGFGDDYPLAHFARALLIKLRPDIRMIPIGGFPVPEEFASITPADTVLVLGLGRRSGMLRNLMGSAARAGARIVLVTSTISAGDKSAASVILRGRSDGPTRFGSMTATVSLLTYLCARLAARIGGPAQDRMRQIEQIHSEWGEESETTA